MLCGGCLYRTLTSYTKLKNFGQATIVLTGDIPAMWIRDSAVQIATYIPRIKQRPALRRVVEGGIRAQAYFILQDPWANAYRLRYKRPSKLPKSDRRLGRGGWVWNRNFELDSIAYFMNLLWNWFASDNIYAPEQLLQEPIIHDAVVLYLRVLQIEQHHTESSPYRYSELPNNGLGPASQVTGMIWSAFRPSDDPQAYSYSVPANIYIAGALTRLLTINNHVWCDDFINASANRLYSDISKGIQEFGIVVAPGRSNQKVYAYEVDGMGNALVDFDDPNIPSLLSIPLLGWDHYDVNIYETTRLRILSPRNPYYYKGTKLDGLGSPHTDREFVWPLSTAMEALTTSDVKRQVRLLTYLSNMATSKGHMPESVHVDAPKIFTRAEFGWANAMLVVAVEQLLGVDCNMLADQHHLSKINEREAKEPYMMPNNGPDNPLFYETLEALIAQ